MPVYLPIAEISVNLFLILGMGGAVGLLSGMFGVGGGFLMTPLLILTGIPPAVAVATGANQLVAASVSGVLAHWRRGNVDIKMGVVLLIGGVAGSSRRVARRLGSTCRRQTAGANTEDMGGARLHPRHATGAAQRRLVGGGP